ncbi:MAG: TolC family protein [Paludibacteraceae bacterium]|nr:TolC family protein [Paludibacteraceae bacterium]MED9996052.1 TolC family protein [Paludibacteraceae bacterium]
MKRKLLITILALSTLTSGIIAQDWTLDQCLQYAKENSISVLQAIHQLETAEQNVIAAKGAFAPNLSASTGQNIGYSGMLTDNGQGYYSANYGINMGMTLYNGGKLSYNKKQSDILVEARNAGILSTQKEIEISILKAYLQVLSAHENVKIAESMLELSGQELERSQILFEAGKITKADLAQVKAQYSQNNYNLISGKNNLRSRIMELKQLLELDITTSFNVAIPEISDQEVLQALPEMLDIYNQAMLTMPQIKEAQLNIQASEYNLKNAKAGYIPSVSLSAGLSGSYNTSKGTNLGQQFTNSLAPSAGISISIPIYDQSKTKTSVAKAKIEHQQTELSYQQTEKQIAKYVESLYIDAQSAQSNYLAAIDKLASIQESYNLLAEQFNVGMKNTVELLSGQNDLLAAQLQLAQSRYQAVISIQLLNILQDKEIKVGQ